MSEFSEVFGDIYGISFEDYKKIEEDICDYLEEFEYGDGILQINSYGKHGRLNELCNILVKYIPEDEQSFLDVNFKGLDEFYRIYLKKAQWLTFDPEIVYPKDPFNQTKQKKFFPITNISREDIFAELSDGGESVEKGLEDKVFSLTDKEMEDIARKVGEMHVEHGEFWEFLSQVAEDVLKEKERGQI